MKRRTFNEIVRVLVQGSRRDLAQKMVEAAGERFVLGPGGLQAPESGIMLQPKTIYFMGASSSPTMIYLTDVAGDMVWYIPYPFYDRSGKLKTPLQDRRWTAEDLIVKGSRTWLKRLSSHFPELAKSIKALLAGKKVKPTNIKDFEPWTALVTSAKPGQDMWRQAERYGNVGGIEGADGTNYYEVEVEFKQLEELKKDSKLKVIETQKGWGPKQWKVVGSVMSEIVAVLRRSGQRDLARSLERRMVVATVGIDVLADSAQNAVSRSLSWERLDSHFRGHPAKSYKWLEKRVGHVLSAPELSAFDVFYNHYLRAAKDEEYAQKTDNIPFYKKLKEQVASKYKLDQGWSMG